MMKVSHPIIVFGHAVKVFTRTPSPSTRSCSMNWASTSTTGLSDLYNKIESLPASQRDEIIEDLHRCHEHRPELAMVDSAGDLQLPFAQ